MSYVSPPQLAKRYGVEPAKVLCWIRSGELRAVNVATRPNGRPRFKIAEADVLVFENRRSGKPDPKPQRQRRQPAGNVIQFFK